MPDAPGRWRLPGPAGGLLIARAGHLPVPKGWTALPPLFASAAIEGVIASGASAVDELYEAVGGTRRTGLPRPAFDEHRREIARCLREAFRSGELVAYRRDPPAVLLLPRRPRPPAEPAPEEPVAEEPESYVSIQMVGEDGNGVPGVRYQLVLPDGSVREGTLDGSGSATVRGRFSGKCKVTFPDLDESAWEPA